MAYTYIIIENRLYYSKNNDPSKFLVSLQHHICII